MITVPQGSGIHIIPLLLLRLSIGSLSRFTGVGGGFIATPALVVLGIPVDLAVGTSLFWVFLNSLAGSIIHRNLGNADVKLGIFLALPSMLGMETGIRLANTMRQAGLQDVAILSLSILLMIVIGTYTLFESLKRKAYIDQIGKGRLLASYQPTPLALKLQGIRLQPMIPFRKSGVTVSLWIILLLGFQVGIVTGLIGTGGGFITVPLLIYILGVPVGLAVGSSTLQVILSSGYGGTRYLASDNVVFPVVLVLLSTSLLGVVYGASVTKCVRDVTVRMALGLTILIVCASSIFKLGWLVSGKTVPALQMLVNWVTFCGITLSMGMVVILSTITRRYRMGKQIPRQFESLFQQQL